MVERGGEVSAIDLEAQLRKLEDAENKVLRLLEIASEVIDTLADSSSASDVSHDSSETLVQKRERLQADTADFLQLIQEVLTTYVVFTNIRLAMFGLFLAFTPYCCYHLLESECNKALCVVLLPILWNECTGALCCRTPD